MDEKSLMEDSFPFHSGKEEWWNKHMEGRPMSKMWYLPLAAVLGAAGLSVWAQASAGPPPGVAPGVVVSTVNTSTGATAAEDTPAPGQPPSVSPAPAPSIAAVPEPVPATRIVPAEPVTLPPARVDDKGGLRQRDASDDSPGHELKDDKGGLRQDPRRTGPLGP